MLEGFHWIAMYFTRSKLRSQINWLLNPRTCRGGCWVDVPTLFSWITHVKRGGLQRNFRYPIFEQSYTFPENFVSQCPATCNLYLVTMSVRITMQGTFCVGMATVSSVFIIKRQNDCISGQWWWPGYNLVQWLVQGHFRSYNVTCIFLLINSYSKEIERCGWSDVDGLIVSLCSVS